VAEGRLSRVLLIRFKGFVFMTKIASCRELEDLVFERIGGENGAVRSLGVASTGDRDNLCCVVSGGPNASEL